MNAASLHMSTSLSTATGSSGVVSGGGGITPAAGQGFMPQPAAEASSAESSQSSSAAPSREQLLATLAKILGDDFQAPFVGADGVIYAERMAPSVVNGALQLSFVALGSIDPASGKLRQSEAMAKLIEERQKEASGSQRVLVKIGDNWVWQTIVKDESGKPVVTDMASATEQEVAAYQQQQAASAAKQGLQSSLQDDVAVQRKIGSLSQNLGLFGTAGQLVSGLAGGPHPYTGRPGGSWLQGWMLTQRLNGKAEGKLLPSWISSGPVATALDWGIQAYGMLDMGRDVQTLRDYFGKAASRPVVNPNAVQELMARGTEPAMAGALNQLGTELRSGSMQVVQGSANAAVLNTKLGAVQLVPKDDLYKAFNATEPATHTGLKVRASIDSGVTKGLGVLGKLVQPAMIGASLLNVASSLISLKRTVKTQGVKALVESQQGRSTLLGAATSTAFLGMYLLPMMLPALGVAVPAVAAASSAINIAQNVLGGVQLVNNYGLFGGDGEQKAGFLDNDAVRAAFLIPPLTPLGAFAFWMKGRKKQAAEKAAQLKAAQQLAVERVKQQREMAKIQLQTSGQVSGASRAQDGSVQVSTGVPNDLDQLAAQMRSGTLSNERARPT